MLLVAAASCSMIMRAPPVQMMQPFGTINGKRLSEQFGCNIPVKTGSAGTAVAVKEEAPGFSPSGNMVRCDDDGCELVDLAPLTKDDVLGCQASWVNAIKTISKTYLDEGDYIGAAGKAAGELYGYGRTNVLFKPTKASDEPFRPTPESAMSYFVGGTAVENGLSEDAGFAINGGKGWSNVVFDNHQVEYIGIVAIAMGTYYFTCATTGDEVRVEYTFGYKRNDDGKARIFLHHSSVPYSP